MSGTRSGLGTTQGEKAQGVVVAVRDVDVGAELTAGKDVHLDPEEALRLR